MASSQTKKQVSKEFRPYAAQRQQRQAEMRSRLQERHQAGLKQAKALAGILKADFGATKVVLFGSMLSADDIHMESDIDLAVWGLPVKKYFAALSRLMDAEAFAVDLVRIEEAPPSLREYILQEGLVLLGPDMLKYRPSINHSRSISSSISNGLMPSYKVLISRLRRTLSDLEAEYAYAQSQAAMARETQQDIYWTAVGLSLHSFYTGLEKAFELIARQVDETIDTSSSRWHKNLLDQMTLDIPGTRPPVIDREVYQYLDEYLAFRHVIRSNYAHRLDPEGIASNFYRLEDCYRLVNQQLNTFCDFLESVN